MTLAIENSLAKLHRSTVPELKLQYLELFGETPCSHNRSWLIRRLAWRLQVIAEGDLSQRAIDRAQELANDADLRLAAPASAVGDAAETAIARDRRLPPPGSLLTRDYKGRQVQVQVLADGFDFEGRVYASLTAVAAAVSGSHANGFLFFGLTQRSRNPQTSKRRTP